ncbi:unnamed protein product [Rotaria magnacalcarata]|uniref:Ferric-chelate reductase 1 n=1 Tax=Rotaria magnacalcarata TaxID=392030 RepID=A0A8S2KD28_9BILA|nr:unnamed protein product [Rotaria magnacalcarata]
MIKFIFILISIKLAYGYPDDAPNSICTVMLPHHDVSPKICQPKYIIQSDTSEYDINQIIRITVRGSTDTDYFKGFLLVAKDQNNQHIIGTWSLSNSSIKTISCNGTDNTVITHFSTENKLQIAALWHAPSFISEGNIFMKSTTTTAASQTNDIRVNITWSYAGSITTVKMMISNLKISQWLAMGLSRDESMGRDHVFICQRLNNNAILLERFINPEGRTRPALASTIVNPGGSFNISLQKFENGITYCDFTLSNFAGTQRRKRQNSFPALSQTASYQPLIAIGNLDSSNNLMQHAQNSRVSLSQTVSLNRNEIIIYDLQSVGSDSTGLMKAHGIIMVFTWIVLVSTGILVARYFKQSWPKSKICGKAVWFGIHRTIMTCVAILTLVAFILILVYKKGQWISQKNQREFAHSIVGILVISFSIIQPFMALFRCNPDAHYRFIFNYVHATVGFSALVLSIAAIFLAMFFTQFQFQLNKEWSILVVWSCWLPIAVIIFETIEFYFRKKNSSLTGKIDVYDMNNLHANSKNKPETIQSIENPTKDRIKLLALLLHIIFAFGLALALMILIGKS